MISAIDAGLHKYPYSASLDHLKMDNNNIVEQNYRTKQEGDSPYLDAQLSNGQPPEQRLADLERKMKLSK